LGVAWRDEARKLEVTMLPPRIGTSFQFGSFGRPREEQKS
jgi:hypothetical protein